MFNAGEIVGKLSLDKSGFAQGMLAAQSMASAFGPQVSAWISSPVAAAVDLLKQSWTAFADASDQAARLGAVLKATGFAAGLTSGDIAKLGEELQKTTRFEDDAVNGAAALLSTFKIANADVFKQTIRLSADLAATMGGDLNSAVHVLGRALADPAAGLGMLSRQGVAFTDAQEKMIKKLVAENDLLGAQKIILGEVASRFGGVAEEMGKTPVGEFAKLKNGIGDLAEMLGETLVPAVQAVTAVMGPLIDAVKWLSEHGLLQNLFGGLGIAANIKGVSGYGAPDSWGDEMRVRFGYSTKDAAQKAARDAAAAAKAGLTEAGGQIVEGVRREIAKTNFRDTLALY